MLTVCTVLRSGGEYEPRHVERLRDQIVKHLPGAMFVALTDQHVRDTNIVRLKHMNWRGWWSKMELFRPDLRGDILYFDLDTEIHGSLEDIASVRKLTVLRDPYANGTERKPDTNIGSGVMYIPEDVRAQVWDLWTTDNFKTLSALRVAQKGDQDFLQPLWQDNAQRWQDVLPGQLVSYKVDCNPNFKTGAVGTVPENARVVFGHGRPRPWSAEWRLTK